MNKRLFLLVAGMITVSAVAVQAKKYHGGFIGPEAEYSSVTVAEVKNLSDDARVMLQGNIISRMSDDDYMFKDSTGSIKVEIDKKDWDGLTVTPQDVVDIRGKVDKHWFGEPEIDVKSLSLVAQPMSATK